MFGANVNAAAKAHALAVFPQESCGLVVGGEYLACTNVAENPLTDFRIDNALGIRSAQAVIHSHPVELIEAKSSPSANDMRSQVSLAVPFGIIDTDGTIANDPYWWGDFKLTEALIGHPFHHGVEDCYLPVRRWFWQHRGIKLEDIPRGDQWWLTDENLYLANFERLGFRQISKHEAQNGDVILGRVNSEVVNHAGVYLDNAVDGKGLVLHHLPGRLSRREPAGPWLNRADLVVRYYAN